MSTSVFCTFVQCSVSFGMHSVSLCCFSGTCLTTRSKGKVWDKLDDATFCPSDPYSLQVNKVPIVCWLIVTSLPVPQAQFFFFNLLQIQAKHQQKHSGEVLSKLVCVRIKGISETHPSTWATTQTCANLCLLGICDNIRIFWVLKTRRDVPDI